MAASVEREQLSAQIMEIAKWTGAGKQSEAAPKSLPRQAIPPEDVQEYQTMSELLRSLQTTEQQLLGRFQEGASVVVIHRARLDAVRKTLSDLEAKYPGIGAVNTAGPANSRQFDLVTLQGQLKASEAKATELTTTTRFPGRRPRNP